MGAGLPQGFWLPGQETDDLTYFNGSQWVVKHRPSASSILTHSGSRGGLAWTAKNTAITHTLLDGAVHTDTSADTVTRGSLIYGNATPAWDELVIGGANTVLRSDGTDASWGDISAAYISNRTRTFDILHARQFTLRAGTPDLALRGTNVRYHAWAFDAAATEGILAEWWPPADYVSGAITVKILWTNLGAGAGDVVWQLHLISCGDGETLNGSGTSDNDTVTAPAQDILDIYSHGISFTPTAGEMIEVIVTRVGTDVADTLGNDAGFVGLVIEYTADM